MGVSPLYTSIKAVGEPRDVCRQVCSCVGLLLAHVQAWRHVLAGSKRKYRPQPAEQLRH